jgi:hypothetical protein
VCLAGRAAQAGAHPHVTLSMDAFWFLLGSALVAGTAVLLAASFRLRALPAFLLAAYVVANAVLVGVAEVLSPFRAVTRAGYLGADAALAVVAAGVWWARGRPRPPLPEIGRIRELKSHPALLLLGGGVALGLVYALVMGLTTPPDTYDALAHQLVRAAAWRQQHSVAPVPDVNDNLGVNASPPNAELQMLFGLVLAGRDTFATIPQFLAECALLVSVFGIARRVGFARDAAAFAALLTGTLAVIALQAATPQDDLIAGAAIAVAAFFLLGRNRADTILAGLAVGVACGTKLTVVFALPAFVLIALAVGQVRRVAAIAATALVSFCCFGAFIYVQHTSNASTVTGYPAGQGSIRAASSLVDTVSTAARILYDFIDLSGFHGVLDNTTLLIVVFFTLPLVAAVVIRSWRRPIAVAISVPFIVVGLGIVAGQILANLHLPLNPPNATSPGHFSLGVNTIGDEIGAFYGPIGTLLVWPLSVWACIAWIRGSVDRRIAALAIALPSAVLVFSFTLSYNPWAGRYFIGPVALAMPLAALVYRNPVLARAAAVVGVFTLVVANIFNADKPIGLAGSRPIWSLSHVEAQTLERPKWRPLLQRVAAKVPEDAHIGLVLDAEDYWSYPFYGPDLSRTVTYLAPHDPLREAVDDHLSWIIVHKHPGPWHIIKVGPKTSATYAAGRATGAGRSRPAG